MKRLLLTLAAAAAFCVAAGAQVYNVDEIVRADRHKLSGCEGPYRFDAPAPTDAPKGFKPFYISHYGRHGSRYAWNSATYTTIKKVLDAAASVGALTPRGEKLMADFTAFYEVPLLNTGDLVALGAEQHREIARIMAGSFPEVFAEGGRVLARSSTSQRAIVSMNAFCVSLQKNAPKVDIDANSLHTNMVIINATGAPRDIAVRRAGSVRLPESTADFRARKYDEAILDLLFRDRSFLEELGGKTSFLSELFTLWQGYHNYCDDDWMEDLFTPEQALAFWEVDNYAGCYAGHAAQRYQQIPLVLDIVQNAEEAIAGSGYRAHLRFGHDTVVNAVCPLLNLDGCGTMPDNADEVKYWFQNYETPMAANIQFILYRSKKDPRILFKVLRNGHESTLPQLEAVSGPYYDWNDFTEWVKRLDAEHPAV